MFVCGVCPGVCVVVSRDVCVCVRARLSAVSCVSVLLSAVVRLLWQSEVTLLRNEVSQLKQLLLAHKDCPVTAMQKKSAYHSE